MAKRSKRVLADLLRSIRGRLETYGMDNEDVKHLWSQTYSEFSEAISRLEA